jgi:hypothetical protein
VGKLHPLSSFNPLAYRKSLGFIQIREGGGRGSGFKLIEEQPLEEVELLYPDVIELVIARLNMLTDQVKPRITEKVKELTISYYELQILRSIIGEHVFSEFILPLLRQQKELRFMRACIDSQKASLVMKTV